MTFTTTTYLEADSFTLALLCVFELEPAEGDGWNSPRLPACATLVQATINGAPVTLTDAQVADLESEALVQAMEDNRP